MILGRKQSSCLAGNHILISIANSAHKKCITENDSDQLFSIQFLLRLGMESFLGNILNQDISAKQKLAGNNAQHNVFDFTEFTLVIEGSSSISSRQLIQPRTMIHSTTFNHSAISSCNNTGSKHKSFSRAFFNFSFAHTNDPVRSNTDLNI